MARPIVLVHGYNGESKRTDPASLQRIYGSLPGRLRALGLAVVEVDLSRYVSLDDGVGVEDLSLGLERVLRQPEFAGLLGPVGFDAITHSTGALVVRNWVRRYSERPSPLRHLIHLAGAQLGSGWAHVGASSAAAVLRTLVHQRRGLAVLEALEHGSPWTLELQHDLLQPGARLLADYGVFEFSLSGSQTSAFSYRLVPIRYGRENGSDGVVRVPATNPNWHYLRFEPTDLIQQDWARAARFATSALTAASRGAVVRRPPVYYHLTERSSPGRDGRAEVPFALVYQCAHLGPEYGIVAGPTPQAQVDRCLAVALGVNDAADYGAAVAAFAAETEATRQQAASPAHAEFWRREVGKLSAPRFDARAEYDPHAMVIVRVRDHLGQPVPDCHINFNSSGGDGTRGQTAVINTAFEDHHRNRQEPGCHCFFLRTDQLGDGGRLSSLLAPVQGVDLEIDSVDPRTSRVRYVPLRYKLSSVELLQWLQGDRAVLLEVHLLRLPDEQTFMLQRT